MVGVDIIIQHETHTLGGMIQFHLVRDFVDLRQDITADTMSKDRPLCFAGYKMPHPLEAAVLISMGTIAEDDVQTTALKVLGECASRLQKDMIGLHDIWVDVVAKTNEKE